MTPSRSRYPGLGRGARPVFTACAVLALLLCGFLRPALGHESLEPVTLQLRWFHQFQFAGYYAAQEKGYYRDAGLDVAIQERDQNQDPVREVLEGRAEFGVSGAEVLLRTLRGDRLVMLAVVFQHSPLVMLAREDTGIVQPRHLKGRTVKMTSHPRDAELQAMLNNAGVTLQELDLYDGEVGHQDYLNPRIDALSAYVTNEPYYLDKQGVDYRLILPRDYGVDFYGDGLFTSRELWDARPELARAFTEASMRGWEYAMAHPDEIIDLIIDEYGSMKSREHLRYEAERMRELVLPELVPMGSMNRNRWRRMAETFIELDMAPRPADMAGTLEAFTPMAGDQPMSPWLRWLLWSLAGLCLAGALVSLGLLIFNRRLQTEVRQRRRAEEELRFHSAILEQIGDLVTATSMGGRIIYVNEAVTRLLGVPRDELAGRNVSAFGEDPEKGASQQEILEGTLAEGSWSGEVVNFARDGRRVVLYCRTWIMRDEHGEPAALCSVSTDITERKQAEQALVQREHELADALERIRFQVANSPLAVVEWKDGTHICQWSRRAEEIFGWSAEEVMGKSWQDFRLTVEEDSQEVGRKINRLFTGEDEYNIIVNRNYAKDGSVLHCQWYNSPLRDASGAIVSILSQVQDITAWTQAKSELIRAKEAAEASNRAKSEFLANMSHEIRTPLNGAMGMLQLLKTTKLDAEQHYFVETAMVSANSLLRILGDILDLSKIESGRMDLLEEPFEVVSVVEPVINAFRETAAAKGVELLVSLDPELPRFLRGDPVRIRQILYNLTGNAIKFTDGGEVSLNIRPLPVGGGDRRRVHITVSDSGPGFEDEQVERLFDTFTQGNSALSRSHGGAGLGLSIVKRLVDLMGGSLAVDSPEGSGAEVHVSLELGVAEAAPSESARHRETAKPSPGEKPCILLAEDDKISRMAMERSLELAGFDAVSVTDGQQALDALQAQQFDAVLMDVRMPVLDGLQAARALREREQEQGLPRTPVIAVTAHAMAGDREQILAAGMDDYVTKPVDMDSLAAALRRILGL